MKKLTKAIVAIMLTVAVICAAGCKKASKIYNVSVSASPSVGGVVSRGGNYEEGQSCTVTAMANDGYLFVEWTESGNVVSTNANYTFSVTDNRNLLASFMRDCEYVDLGLPSGTLWATCNVGATTPEGYGNYYAWGETTTKPYSYNWNTYEYCNRSGWALTKYCNFSSYGNYGFTDNLTTLQISDDAARANWGGDWRMPTKAEWEELLNNTTVTWTIQNFVYGRKFTASNGNSLFLPGAGCWDGEFDDAGSYGYYWSSSLYTDYPNTAWYLYFYSRSYSMNCKYRYCGGSVRAVLPASKN